ncbi:hypothetical protein A1O3_05830 [Capronia epimyces CBS 606.96]|uniref:Ketoreductase domain-containing protein n=1 Tax=Capronia epimyces CBS 606.96 TaxID=1182542 RepID=W9Y687_9EURO|nr:uncharacterized protein A1O3_05830 [Capronia epimyces CBS 606.96]EXJ85155.1 hypothetical protein A1O3_05830 [Capronia epimyces CBS 606.96]
MAETEPQTQAAAPGSFHQRTVIVTGGAGFIGAPLCKAFARAGANVVVNDYGCSVSGEGSSASPAEQVAQEIRAEGLSAVADMHNVATDAEQIVATALARFGRVDVIVNNAGITIYGPVEAQGPEAMRRVFEVNALGAMALCHYAWPHMQRQAYGRVVNVTSDSVFGMADSSPYVLSRGAVLGVTRTLALEGRPHNILVNAVGPSAYSRMRMAADEDSRLPAEQHAQLQARYPGESNVPAILALASEKLDLSGEIWSTGSYALGRTILGTVKDVKGLRTLDECLQAMQVLMDKDREWTEPHSIADYAAFKSKS